MSCFPDEDVACAYPEPSPSDLPVLVPAATALCASAHLAISLIGIHVRREGVEFRIERRIRRKNLPHSQWQRMVTAFVEHGSTHAGAASADRLHYGLRLADGDHVLTGGIYFHGGPPGRHTHRKPATTPTGYSLIRTGGGGGQGDGVRCEYAASDQLWLCPLPPAEAIEIVLRWPSMGIRENRTRIDLRHFYQLAAAAQPLPDA